MPFYEGKIERIGIFELNENQKKGFNADKTHNIGVKLSDGCSHWMTVTTVTRNPDYDLTWRKKINDKYTDIYEGAEVEFMYNINDKGYWDPKLKTLEIKKNGDQYPKAYDYYKAKDSSSDSSPQSSAKTKSTYNNTGVEVGHCLNAALNLINHDPKKMKDSEGVIQSAKDIHNITKNMREAYREQNQSLSDYDVGARVGHSVLNACRLVDKVSQVQKAAEKILYSFVPQIEDYVKRGSNSKENPVVTPKETPPKQEKPKEPEPQQDSEFDDGIPF